MTRIGLQRKVRTHFFKGMVMSGMDRRSFLKKSALAGAAFSTFAVGSSGRVLGANDRIRVAVAGIHGRGKSHMGAFAGMDGVEVSHLVDPDSNLFDSRSKIVEDKGGNKPKCVQDIREVLDDDSVDAVSIATCNHWHSLMTVWACQAGKDVYVEKPCSHNIWEGRQLVNASHKYDRIVQHGTQIRSSVAIQEAMQKLRDGVIGEVYMARGLCYRWRPSIGNKPDCPVPAGVHYDTWLGPAPERPFNPNRFLYNWHWHWAYGNGDIGNQGVHQMDIARWGLGVGLPTSVTSHGHMYLFDDQKEVPNVILSAFNYPDAGEKGRVLVFDVRPWMTNDEKGAKVGVLFYGSEGYMVIDSYSHYQVYLGRKEEKGPGRDEGGNHWANFIKAVRAHDRSILNAPIDEGHLSACLCHLGLTSARLGRSLKFDPKTERYIDDDEANKYVTRDYRKPFVVPSIEV